MEDLKWEVEQKQREIEAQKQQLEMMEQCHHRELDNLQKALQASGGGRETRVVSPAGLHFYYITSQFALTVTSSRPNGDIY